MLTSPDSSGVLMSAPFLGGPWGESRVKGPLMEGPDVGFKKCQCRMSLSLDISRPLSNLRIANVPCHYII